MKELLFILLFIPYLVFGSDLHRKVDSLNQLSDSLCETDILRSLKYAQDALVLSISEHYMQGEARASYLIGYNETSRKNYEVARKFISNSRELYNEINIPDMELLAIQSLGTLSYYENDFLAAVKISKEGTRITGSEQYPQKLDGIYTNLGLFYYRLSEIDSALYYFISAINFKQEVGNKKGVLIASMAIGDIYTDKGNYSMAKKYYEAALDLAIATKIKKRMKPAYLSLSRLHEKKQGNGKSTSILQTI